jgi:predicted NBD/HSP70 family sugar kinase
LAHVVVDPHGEQCYCGNHGCLGAYVGTKVIVARAQKAVKQGKWKREGEADITYEEIISTARAGEPVLKNILEQTGHFLGLGLVDLVHVFNPTKIIITGNGVKAGDLVLDAMYRIIRERIKNDFGQTAEIVIPPWQHIDWAQGAASLVLQELYRSPFNRIRPVI